MIWTVPNVLTMGRLLAAPLLAIAALLGAPWLTFGLFIAAAVTDFLDGWLARRLGQISPVGTMLDPIADKAMVLVALLVLVAMRGDGAALLIPATLIVFREVLVAGIREYLGDVKLAVTRLAKWKTAIQMVAVGTLLVPEGFGEPVVPLVGLGLLYAAAGLTLITGADYLTKALNYLKDRGTG